MMAPRRDTLTGVLCLLLAGCATTVKTVTVDPAQLRVAQKAAIALTCPYRLGEVVDARAHGDQAGQLGLHRLQIDDPTALVRDSLQSSGFLADAADAAAPRVQVALLQLYIAQNHVTKIPVVVYRVRVDAAEPFLVRAQPASMNWNGSQNEAVNAYRAALTQANAQLVARLNGVCSTPVAAPAAR